MYAVTLLTDEELKQAIAENVLHPDMNGRDLEKWRRELSRKVELAPSPKEESGSAARQPADYLDTRRCREWRACLHVEPRYPEHLASDNSPWFQRTLRRRKRSRPAQSCRFVSTAAESTRKFRHFWIAAQCRPKTSACST